MSTTGIHPKSPAVSPAIHPKANGNVNANGRLAANLTQPSARQAETSRSAQIPAQPSAKSCGYGLPCAKCHLYYPADLDACPTCKNRERVAAVVSGKDKYCPAPQCAVPGSSNAVPDSAAIEQEREEFLRQFKAQLADAAAQVAAVQGTLCALPECHTEEEAEAEICRACYERLQERLDIYEAALHMDLKEASQIVYNAVWADPSDPAKTYENAAAALLAELRKRTGTSSVLSRFHPLSH